VGSLFFAQKSLKRAENSENSAKTSEKWGKRVKMPKIADIALFTIGCASVTTGVGMLFGLPVALVVFGVLARGASVIPDTSRRKPPQGGA
jgi:ABC-type spermidine/putrescine transport system permease subunit I